MMNNKTIEKSNIVLCFISFLYVAWPIKDLGLSSIIYEALAGIYIFSYLAIKKSKIKISRINLMYIWIAVVLTIMFFLPNSSPNPVKTRPIIINFLFCSFLICATIVNKIEFDKFQKIFIVASLFYSAINIVSVLFPSFYINYLLPILKGVDKEKAILFLRNGYGIIIDNTASYLPNLLSIAISILASEYYINRRINSKQVVVLLLLVISFLLYGRRSELISIVIALLFTLMMFSNSLKKTTIKRIVVSLFLFILFIFVINYFINLGYFPRIKKTIDQIVNLSNKTIDYGDINSLSTNRLDLWKTAISDFISNPLFGVGWGNFIYRNGINAHNTYLQFLCEGGVIGFVLLMFPIIYLYRRTIKTIIVIRAKNNTQAKKSILISFCMQTYFLLLNFVDPAFYKTYFTFLFAICVVLLEYSIKLIRIEINHVE